MGRIRPFETADVPAVVALRRLLFPRSRNRAPDDLERYFARMYLSPPWPGDDLPSLVYEESGGVILGFVGLIPRRMRQAGRDYRVAIVTNLMVHPDSRGLPGVRLLREALGGFQDISLTDRANTTAMRLWNSFGGVSATLFNLHWTRPLQPMQDALRRHTHARWARAAVAVTRPVWRLCDLALGAWGEATAPRTAPPGTLEPLDVGWMTQHAEEFFPPALLHPVYNRETAAFVLEELASKTGFGRLQALRVRLADGQVHGWFLYYANPRGTSHVLQIAAKAGAEQVVFDHLIHAAGRAGATAVQGRVQPCWMGALSRPGFRLHQGGPVTLVHTHDPALLAAVLAGQMYFSRLDGEWWVNF